MEHFWYYLMLQPVAQSFESSIRDMIIAASPMAKMVLLLLLFFSVFSWAVIIDKIRAFKTVESEDAQFLKMYRGNTGSWENVYRQSVKYQSSPKAQMFRAGYRQRLAELEQSGPAPDSSPGSSEQDTLSEGEKQRMMAVLDHSGRLEVKLLESFLTFLATTGAVSPFIGLFGTVWGIMNSFRGLGAYGSASIAVVAPGIAEALIATAAGLAAAIPAVIAYNHFLRRLNGLSDSLQDFTREFMGNLIP